MSKTLAEIAQQLIRERHVSKKVKNAEEVKPVPKVQMIYAFNGTGKTRLSREFKELIAPKTDGEGAEPGEQTKSKILYYNAFTEDLFYWDNDLEFDAEPKLKIQPNSFTDWVLKDQGQDQNITTIFQHYTNEKLTPRFNEEYEKIDKDENNQERTIKVKAFSEVTFSLGSGDDESAEKLKISKGEESCFIWSIFYALLEQVVGVLNVAEPSEREINDFDALEYVFIDDPVSSLDDNHLIDLAVSMAELIKSSKSDLKFIITTHNTLFYNVLYNELNTKTCYLLERVENGTFTLVEKKGDSNKSFSYHLYIMQIIEKAIAENTVEKYHFMLLRNLYEKTASFLGYQKWGELLPEDRQLYFNRIMQFASHSTLSNEVVALPTQEEKATVKFLLDHLKNTYVFAGRRS